MANPTTHATKVQIAATVKATATAQSQMFVSLSFIGSRNLGLFFMIFILSVMYN
jgi:hypothetical protein